MMRTRTLLAALLMATALTSVGCASPRIVRGITSRGDTMKFLYQQGNDTGVIRCRLGTDGALSECRRLTVVVED